jgi:UDP-glucose 4-epimerase
VQLIDKLFSTHRFDYVYHLAAYAAEVLSAHIKRFNYENNVIGSVNLINASVNYGVKCFVFTSSIAVYGALNPPFHETMICHPEDSYGIAKLAVERELKISHDMFGLDYVILRPHNIYGPHQNIGDRYRNVVGIFMNQCLKGQPMTIFGDGLQERAFSYIDDVTPIIAEAVDIPAMKNHIFNVGSDSPTTVLTLAKMVNEVMGVEHLYQWLPERKEVKAAFSDHTKLRHLRDWPKTSLKAGLAKMAAWVKQHGPRESKSFSNIEIEKNLPESWKT